MSQPQSTPAASSSRVVLEYMRRDMFIVIALLVAAVLINSIGYPLVRDGNTSFTLEDMKSGCSTIAIVLAILTAIMSPRVRRL